MKKYYRFALLADVPFFQLSIKILNEEDVIFIDLKPILNFHKRMVYFESYLISGKIFRIVCLLMALVSLLWLGYDRGTDIEAQAAGARKPAGCMNSECLLKFSNGDQNPKTGFMKSRSLKIIKVEDEPLDKAMAREKEKAEDPEIASLEAFLSSYEPGSGPSVPAANKKAEKIRVTSAVKPISKPVLPVKGSKVSVKKLRMGEHGDYTRIVLDVSDKAKIVFRQDEKENMVYAEIPGVAWEGSEKWYSDKSPLVMAWLAKPMENGKGTRLIISLRKKARLIHEEYLSPSGYPWHRIIFDLQAS